METVIKTEKLTKIYHIGFRAKPLIALENLNLEVYKGEIFGFLGHNGAGKSTAIKILMSLIYPTSGKAWLFGEDLTNIKIRSQIGFLPEVPYFYDYLTGKEFLQYYAQLYGINSKKQNKKIDEVLELVNLLSAKNLQLRKYSKGMNQRIGVAQALLNEPKLAILDEPMGGLDPIGRKEVRDIILNLKERGTTVFFSTHILADVEMICDRIAILLKGKLREIGKLNELLSERIYSIEVTIRDFEEKTKVWLLENSFLHHITKEGEIVITLSNLEAMNQLLDDLHQQGAIIVSVVPYRRTLEDLFMNELQEVVS